jgi:hypothetical protein
MWLTRRPDAKVADPTDRCASRCAANRTAVSDKRAADPTVEYDRVQQI